MPSAIDSSITPSTPATQNQETIIDKLAYQFANLWFIIGFKIEFILLGEEDPYELNMIPPILVHDDLIQEGGMRAMSEFRLMCKEIYEIYGEMLGSKIILRKCLFRIHKDDILFGIEHYSPHAIKSLCDKFCVSVHVRIYEIIRRTTNIYNSLSYPVLERMAHILPCEDQFNNVKARNITEIAYYVSNNKCLLSTILPTPASSASAPNDFDIVHLDPRGSLVNGQMDISELSLGEFKNILQRADTKYCATLIAEYHACCLTRMMCESLSN